MPVSELRQWLLQHRGFQRQNDALILSAVAREFPRIELDQPLSDHNWRYLLLCGSAFARSDKTDEQRAALRIADTCLQTAETTGEERAAAAIILDTMANRRTILLAAGRDLIPRDIEAELPLPLKADFLRGRSKTPSLVLMDGDSR